MKLTLFKLVLGIALGLGPVQAMYDAQEEDKLTSSTKILQQSTARKEATSSISSKKDVSVEALPDELCMSVFSFLDIRDLGQVVRVSTRWKRVTEDPILWRYMGSRYYGDYLINLSSI